MANNAWHTEGDLDLTLGDATELNPQEVIAVGNTGGGHQRLPIPIQPLVLRFDPAQGPGAAYALHAPGTTLTMACVERLDALHVLLAASARSQLQRDALLRVEGPQGFDRIYHLKDHALTPTCLAVHPKGPAVMACVDTELQSGHRTAVLIGIGPQGDVAWANLYRWYTELNHNIVPVGVIASVDGGWELACNVESVAGGRTLWFLALDAQGALRRDMRIGFGDEYALTRFELAPTNVRGESRGQAVGFIRNPAAGPGYGMLWVRTVLTSAGGVWAYHVVGHRLDLAVQGAPAANAFAYGVTPRPNGGALITGSAWSSTTNANAGVLLSLSNTGQIQWVGGLGAKARRHALYDLARLSDGTVLGVGGHDSAKVSLGGQLTMNGWVTHVNPAQGPAWPELGCLAIARWPRRAHNLGWDLDMPINCKIQQVAVVARELHVQREPLPLVWSQCCR